MLIKELPTDFTDLEYACSFFRLERRYLFELLHLQRFSYLPALLHYIASQTMFYRLWSRVNRILCSAICCCISILRISNSVLCQASTRLFHLNGSQSSCFHNVAVFHFLNHKPYRTSEIRFNLIQSRVK